MVGIDAPGKTEAVTKIEKQMRERFIGTILGAAVGDALGAPVEFMTAREIARQHGTLKEMVGGGKHSLECGEYTDDTSMMLCIAESLIAKKYYCPDDIAKRFVIWYRSNPKDIGHTTREALNRLDNGMLFFASGVQGKPTNGSIMRCAPLSLAYLFRENVLIDVSMEVSAITHTHIEARLSCAFINLMIAKLLLGANQKESYNCAVDKIREINCDFVKKYIDSSYNPDPGEGLAVNTLLLATSSFLGARSFEEAVVRAVNLGGDADTTGTVTGALAGAYFGRSNIPTRWFSKLNPKPANHFVRLGERLFDTEMSPKR